MGFAGGINKYAYASESPTNFVDPTGEIGVGVSIGGSAEIGQVTVGAGTTGAGGYGGFLDTNNWSLSDGGFASLGAFASLYPYGASYPTGPGTSNGAYGAFAGAGANIVLTNANNVQDLGGPFTTYSFNAGLGVRVLSLQLSLGQNDAGQSIWEFSYGGPIPGLSLPTGVGYGFDFSKYNTNTWTTHKCR
jgi:hypothetical protein